MDRRFCGSQPFSAQALCRGAVHIDCITVQANAAPLRTHTPSPTHTQYLDGTGTSMACRCRIFASMISASVCVGICTSSGVANAASAASSSGETSARSASQSPSRSSWLTSSRSSSLSEPPSCSVGSGLWYHVRLVQHYMSQPRTHAAP